MTSSQVTNQKGIMNMAWMNSERPNVKTEGVDFSSFMGNTGRKAETGNTVKTDVKTAKNDDDFSKTDKGSISDNTKGRNKISGTKVKEEKIPGDNEIEAVKDTIEAIEKAIEDALDITPEQLNEALMNLGLNQMALLNPENILELSLELTGTEDTLSLVTNGELYETINSLTDTVKNLVDELTKTLAVKPEEFAAAIEKAEELIPEISEQPVEKPITNVKSEGAEKEEPVLEEKVSFNDESVKEIKNFSIHNNNASRENNEGAETKTADTEAFREEIPEIKEAPVSFVDNLVEKTKEALSVKEPETTYTTEQVRNIMDQITESIKVTMNDDVSEISLKLHPESLGNVSVRVSANSEGVLTAQFTAQNESVKAVIEAQTIVLREALESKGVTVEAVEVMVGTHEFERNLSDNERHDRENQGKKNTVRRINLSEMTEEIEDDEDIIRTEMMRQNGNTIDYTA